MDLTTFADKVFGVTVAAIIMGKALQDAEAMTGQVLFYGGPRETRLLRLLRLAISGRCLSLS